MNVAGEASDGYEVVERARELNPDVILLDLVMPGQSGLRLSGRFGPITPTRVCWC
jgi:CheY-like chemotaxis protein